MTPIEIKYQFIFPNGRTHSYEIRIAPDTGLLIPPENTPTNEAWTDLAHKKCANCPLNQATHPKCPVARNMAIVVADFKGEKSIEKVTAEVTTQERKYRKNLALQEGLFGIFGLIMATSECPHFEFLRPMARFHLPFSNFKETSVRSVGFYLLRQYFLSKRGETPDFDLKNLTAHYAALETVNRGMADRIRSITTADAEANSIVILDGFAKILNSSISRGLDDLEALFKS